jgi:hypothetical protein
MRASIKLKDFGDALKLVSKPGGPYVQLQAADGQLVIASYSDACHVKTRTAAQIDGKNVCVLLLQPLATFVKAAAGMFKGEGTQAVLEIAEDWAGSISIEGAKAVLLGTNPENYPKTDPPQGAGLTTGASALTAALEQVSSAVGGQELSPQYQGVCLMVDEGVLRAMATDTRQAAMAVVGEAHSPWDTVVLEKRDAEMLIELCKGQDQVQLWTGTGHRLWAHAGPHTMVTSTVVVEGGQYPNLPKRLAGPDQYAEHLTVDPEVWQPAVAAAIACNAGSADRAASLTLSPEGAAIDVASKDGDIHLPFDVKTQSVTYNQKIPMGRLSDRIRHAGPGLQIFVPEVEQTRTPLRIEAPGYTAWVMAMV